MTNHNLRYYALGAYTGLVALWSALGTLQVSNETVAAAVLAPIALVIGADIVKHRESLK